MDVLKLLMHILLVEKLAQQIKYKNSVLAIVTIRQILELLAIRFVQMDQIAEHMVMRQWVQLELMT